MDEGSSDTEQGIVRLPQITERSLELDYKNLERLGYEKFHANRLLERLNKVFSDKTIARQMLDQYRENVGLLKQKPSPSHTETLKISALEIFGKFLDYASRDNSESALLILKSASTGVNQHNIVETRSDILNVERQPFFNTAPKMQAADAFFELSSIMYASAHEGRFYQSDATQQRIEEMKTQIRNINIR